MTMTAADIVAVARRQIREIGAQQLSAWR